MKIHGITHHYQSLGDSNCHTGYPNRRLTIEKVMIFGNICSSPPAWKVSTKEFMVGTVITQFLYFGYYREDNGGVGPKDS